nr:hypothetical protein [Tanacetum cinerariifolium]
MDQNIDFSGSGQIQTPQYPEIYHPSQEIRDEVFQVKGDLMESIQTFLEEFNYIPLKKSHRSYCKLDLQIIIKELIECNLPTFFDNNEEHSVQHKENLENSSSSIQETEGPPQDSDIRQLIREECCIEVSEEQKQNMEDTILELVEICRQKELLCMHDNVDDLIESAFNSKLLLINSQRLNKEKQEVKNVVEQPAERRTLHAVAPILSTKEHGYSPSMGYEHPNTTLETKSDEIKKSSVEELVPILSENEVTSEDKREYIEYVEASLPDPEIVRVEKENIVYQEEEEVDLEDVFQIQDVVLREKLLSINRLIANIESLNENLTPDRERLINVVKNNIFDDSLNDPLLEEADLFLASDNSIPPGIENFAYDSEGDIHFLEALLIDDSISFPNNESSDFDFDNPSFPRPPPEPPDADFELDAGEEISVVIPFMFVIYSKMFSFLLSAESEDTIFDPAISVESRWIYPSLIEVSCVRFYCLGPRELHILSLRLVWGNLYP